MLLIRKCERLKVYVPGDKRNVLKVRAGLSLNRGWFFVAAFDYLALVDRPGSLLLQRANSWEIRIIHKILVKRFGAENCWVSGYLQTTGGRSHPAIWVTAAPAHFW